MYDRFYRAVDGFFVRPEFDDRNQIHVSTGQSYGNQCLYNWWKLNKWFTDNKIKYYPIGDGCPDLDERACDFAFFITEEDKEQKPDPFRVSELKTWLYCNSENKRIDDAAKKIGITRDEIINGISAENNFGEMLRELLGEESEPFGGLKCGYDRSDREQ